MRKTKFLCFTLALMLTALLMGSCSTSPNPGPAGSEAEVSNYESEAEKNESEDEKDESEAEKISVMSYNINGFDVTEERTAAVSQLIGSYMPDIVFLQEPAQDWMTKLEANFSEYYGFVYGLERHGVNNDAEGARGANSFQPILYAKDRYEMIEWGTKWLSDTPDTVSKFAEADYYRILTYAKMKDNTTGKTFVAVNNHLDTAHHSIRKREIVKIVEILNELYPNEAIIFAGDMNSGITEEGLEFLTKCKFVYAGHSAGNIDWIFYTPDTCAASNWVYVKDEINGSMPSDHPAVYCEITLKSSVSEKARNWADVLAEESGGINCKTDDETGFGPVHPIY